MEKIKKHWKIIVAALVVLIGLGALAGGSDGTKSTNDNKIKVSVSSSQVKGKDYQDIESAFRGDGFTNITVEPITDLVTGWLTKDGSVESVSIDGSTQFTAGKKYSPDVAIIISYHTFANKDTAWADTDNTIGEDKQNSEASPTEKVTTTPSPTESVQLGENEILLPAEFHSYYSKDYKELEKAFKDLGFTDVRLVPMYDIVWGITKEGSIEDVTIAGNTILNYTLGNMPANLNDEVLISYHMLEKNNPDATPTPTPTPKPEKKASFHSSDSYEEAKKGNSGVYAYKHGAGTYYIYIIIDFDEGYVYDFTVGNGNEICWKLKIDEGDLVNGLTYTYHEDPPFSYTVIFKWGHPDSIQLLDNYNYTTDYSNTTLKKALSERDKMSIVDK